MEKLTKKQIEKLILSGAGMELSEMLSTGNIFERPEICRLCKGKCCKKHYAQLLLVNLIVA
ncbi:MAG: hypothetical protein HFJ18_04045 [Clostridia bacterium]|nr:hypothetical protein [Clostridia bacterium]